MSTLLERMAVTAKPKVVTVNVDGWGEVHIAALTVGQIDAIRKDEDSSIVKSFARFIVNADGSRLFDLDNPAHLELLQNQPFNTVQEILKHINAINALTVEAVEDVKKG